MAQQEVKDSKPLAGIKVLDFTQFLSGPFCTMMMADMGAEVIKLEHPPLGDPTRYVFPGKGGLTTSFGSPNRGKKTVMMDLKNEDQKKLFFEMLKDADIVIDNFKPGTMQKMGCGYEVLKEIKPDIIMTEISGFGTTGPMRNRAAYDMIIQAYSGLISVTGEKGGTPVRTGASMGDVVGGLGACKLERIDIRIGADRHDVERGAQEGDPLGVALDDRDAVALLREILCQCRTDLTGADDDDVHTNPDYS